MKCSSTFFVNLGNDRHAITYRVKRMAPGSDFSNMNWVLGPENRREDSTIKKTMIFVNQVPLMQEILHHLRSILPSDEQDLIMTYHARRTSFGKDETIKRFLDGRYRVLITTEAAGMVSLESAMF